LAQTKQRAECAGVSDVKVHAGWGDPAEVIIETARREQGAGRCDRDGPARPWAPGRIAPWQRVAKGCEPRPMSRDLGSMSSAVANPASAQQRCRSGPRYRKRHADSSPGGPQSPRHAREARSMNEDRRCGGAAPSAARTSGVISHARFS
jgi:hypothetical protein